MFTLTSFEVTRPKVPVYIHHNECCSSLLISLITGDLSWLYLHMTIKVTLSSYMNNERLKC